MKFIIHISTIEIAKLKSQELLGVSINNSKDIKFLKCFNKN